MGVFLLVCAANRVYEEFTRDALHVVWLEVTCTYGPIAYLACVLYFTNANINHFTTLKTNGKSTEKTGSKRRKVDVESLPSNIHSMETSQLKSVCAAHGITTKGLNTKKEILAFLEGELHDDGTAPLRLEATKQSNVF